MTGRLLLVSPRPPRQDGQGDQRRAHEILVALSGEWRVDVVSWLPDADHSGKSRWFVEPLQLARALVLALWLPATVAYVQGRAPRSLAEMASEYDLALFVTHRAVPPGLRAPFVIDFVDDLGGAAQRRAETLAGLPRWFWRWQAGRMRRLDRRLAARAEHAVAHSAADSAEIAPSVRTIPLAVGTQPLPDTGEKVAFFGNLFYAPNHEAGMWVCRDLVPCLDRLGIEPKRVVIAGRRPRPALREQADAAGVELRADLPDLTTVLEDAAVVLVPMRIGVGAIYKLLDAIGAGRACVITPLANAGLGLVDGQSALVRERDAEEFAAAVVELLADEVTRRRLAREARRHIAPHLPAAVSEAWRDLVRQAARSSPGCEEDVDDGTVQ